MDEQAQNNTIDIIITVLVMVLIVRILSIFLLFDTQMAVLRDSTINTHYMTSHQAEITTEMIDLQNKYYENSENIYNAYLESFFMATGANSDLVSVETTEEDINMIAMNMYADKYMYHLLERDRATINDEITLFVVTFKNTLMKNQDIADLIQERDELYKAIINLYKRQ